MTDQIWLDPMQPMSYEGKLEKKIDHFDNEEKFANKGDQNYR